MQVICRIYVYNLPTYFLVRMIVWSLAAAMPVQWNTLRALTGLGACGSTCQVYLVPSMQIIAYAFRYNNNYCWKWDKMYFNVHITCTHTVDMKCMYNTCINDKVCCIVHTTMLCSESWPSLPPGPWPQVRTRPHSVRNTLWNLHRTTYVNTPNNACRCSSQLFT